MSRAGRFARNGGWVLAGAAITFLVALVAALPQLRQARSRHAVGDGRTVGSYGFPLGACQLPRQLLVASGMPKDGLRALVDPPVWTPEQADAAAGPRARLLVPSDRVVGVELNGAARAYPLRFLAWHEVVDDTLGGVPVAVTYNPLCDSVVVFRREVGGAVATFGVSGLLYESNLLMYDRRDRPQGESLWSQLLFRAVAGPAVSAELEVLPCSVESWGDWRRAHPATSLLAPDSRLLAQYTRDPYSSYLGSDLLRFPVAPLPDPARFPLKTPVVALGRVGAWTAFPFPLLADGRAGAAGPGAELARALTYRGDVPTVAVATDRLPPGTGVVYAAYFAWYATHAGDSSWAHTRAQ